MFGKPFRKNLVIERILNNGVKITTTLKTIGHKHLILFEDGTMISTYHPDQIIGISEEIETVQPEELMDAIESIEKKGSISDFLFNKSLNKFQNINN